MYVNNYCWYTFTSTLIAFDHQIEASHSDIKDLSPDSGSGTEHVAHPLTSTKNTQHMAP